jgi:O-antigen/teichoic acid export membrane protein
LSGIKKLAGDTLWYGGSSIAARFLNYLLTPYLTANLDSARYGDMSLVYAAIPFLNVLFTYGLETAYFRYVQKEEYKKDIYSTTSISLFVSTIILSIILFATHTNIANFVRLNDHPEFITYSVFIIAFDTLSTLPFAKLRQDSRPKKFASIRIASIAITMLLTYFFISVCPKMVAANPSGWVAGWYVKDYGVGYVIIANLVASSATLLFLYKEFISINFKFNAVLWKQMVIYSLPLLVAGFGGMINETFDRIMLGWWAPVATQELAKAEIGIYSACYKLSILISLFIQAFRMGAEPFFFKQAAAGSPQKMYARVMKFFVITISVMFLFVALYLDIWKHFIRRNEYWAGLKVVPILLLANMFLGIYYNLSVWYKLSQKTIYGAWITLIGAAVTLIINAIFIRYYSYMACAWATFFCYGSMMVISFVWGQKHYRIPYAWKKLLAYIFIVVNIYFLHSGITHYITNKYFSFLLATILIAVYCKFITLVEHKEFSKLPVVGKYFLQKKHS